MQSQELDFLQMTVLCDCQVSPNKSRGQRRRARRKTALPRSPDEKPDPEDPEAGCVAVPCRLDRQTLFPGWHLWSRVFVRQLRAGH